MIDFIGIKTVSLGDARPELPDVEFVAPKVRRVSIRNLEQWTLNQRATADSCRAFANDWKNDPTINDGQWLSNLYDLARALFLVEVYADEIVRQRAKNRRINTERPPRRR